MFCVGGEFNANGVNGFLSEETKNFLLKHRLTVKSIVLPTFQLEPFLHINWCKLDFFEHFES